MADINAVVDQAASPAPAAVQEPVVQAPAQPPVADPNDPFSVDEARLSTFAPEQRAVLDEWKKKASETIETRGKSAEEKYKAHVEKATALDQLTRHPEFQKWWVSQQEAGKPKPAVNSQDVATPDEWSSAIVEASNGDASKLQAIQAKMWSSMATPIVQQLQQKQQLLEATMEMKNLFERHPDAKDLHEIGANAADKSPSLLEIAMDYAVTKQGKTMEEGYKLAKSWEQALGSKANQAALGMVQDKKDSVTASTSTNQPGGQVVEVGSTDELIQRNMEAMLSGQKRPRFVVKK